MTNSTAARTVLKFRWLFVTLVLAFAIYLGQFDFLLKPKAPPAAPSTYLPINVRFFETYSEAEQVCGKSNISVVADGPPDGRFVCSDEWWR